MNQDRLFALMCSVAVAVGSLGALLATVAVTRDLLVDILKWVNQASPSELVQAAALVSFSAGFLWIVGRTVYRRMTKEK